MDSNDYVSGQGFCCYDNSPKAARAKMLKARAVSNNFHDTEEYERMQFYYHPDHLGSSSYITNLDGEVVQHIEYVPFGEVLIEERNNMWNTPYLFNSRASRTQYQTYLDIAETKPTIIFDNAKEYDEETGMYYYGARYYEPRISLWMSTDPMENNNPYSSTYTYCLNNPIRFIDPDGNRAWPWERGSLIEYRGNGVFGLVMKNFIKQCSQILEKLTIILPIGSQMKLYY